MVLKRLRRGDWVQLTYKFSHSLPLCPQLLRGWRWQKGIGLSFLTGQGLAVLCWVWVCNTLLQQLSKGWLPEGREFFGGFKEILRDPERSCGICVALYVRSAHPAPNAGVYSIDFFFFNFLFCIGRITD